MIMEENATGHGLMFHYGDCIASYEGEGVLTLEDRRKLDCRFEAGQLHTGDVILLCDFTLPLPFFEDISATRFEGRTSAGFEVRAEGGITETNFLPPKPTGRSSAGGAFHLSEMTVKLKDAPARRARFGLTNFKFFGTTPCKTGAAHQLALPLTLSAGGQSTDITIVPLEQYGEVMRRVQTLHGIDVTCEVVVEVPEGDNVRPLTELVDDLCRILSVARGTKVQWIYYDLHDGSGERVLRYHYSAVTKPYAPLAIIDHLAEGRLETKSFVEGAYAPYIEKRDVYKLNRGTIDAYLDAKAQDDYLEMRGAKLAVALERLKAVFFAAPGAAAEEFIIDESDYQKIAPEIRKAIDSVLLGPGYDKDTRQAICGEGKVLSLNRRSFAYALKKLFKDIDLNVSRREADLFVQCRNKLVHTGEFYCVAATPAERAKVPPLANPQEEHRFLVNFLDQIFLRLLGYRGPYVDWRHTKGSIHKTVL